MELDFVAVGRSMDRGVSQSTFKAVSEDESVSNMWGDGDVLKRNCLNIHFENTHVTTTYWRER
jgi:hypothetical protein